MIRHNQDLITLLDKYDLDIRKTHNARCFDQKCTPDVVYFVADCIMNIIDKSKTTFYSKDIWESPYFVAGAVELFNKPSPHNKNASREYDKFISQPLLLLTSAHILSISNDNKANIYSIEEPEILSWISSREENALSFLYLYFHKIFVDSNFIRQWDSYAEKSKHILQNLDQIHTNAPLKSYRNELYDLFGIFIRAHTKINGYLEPPRIFHKIFNVFSFINGLPGTRGQIKSLSDIRYNQRNIRDIDKNKRITRKEWLLTKKLQQKEKEIAWLKFKEEKCKRLIRQKYYQSEVHDKWSLGEATQVHHIFPKNEYPQYAATIENMILLTAQQHYTKAHPNNSTTNIDKNYQMICLLSKSNSIEVSIVHENDENFYCKGTFISLINDCLNISIPAKSTFPEIRVYISNAYSKS